MSRPSRSPGTPRNLLGVPGDLDGLRNSNHATTVGSYKRFQFIYSDTHHCDVVIDLNFKAV